MITRYLQFIHERSCSFRHAINGITHVFTQETNFRLHVVLLLTAVGMGILLNIRLIEWCVIFLCSGLVVVMEIANTAIERLCDIIHPGLHDGVKIIKDVMAGAVLIAAIISFAIGLVIFLPYFI